MTPVDALVAAMLAVAEATDDQLIRQWLLSLAGENAERLARRA